ncbi:MAG: hypothetical protein H0V17_15720 [Deltaproteobacteria bacterium]|nr:hypothetical protein [Deltaproteobacteria bacterium]
MPRQDPAALASAAERLIASFDETRAMGARARQRIETLYDANQVAANMVDTMGL